MNDTESTLVVESLNELNIHTTAIESLLEEIAGLLREYVSRDRA